MRNIVIKVRETREYDVLEVMKIDKCESTLVIALCVIILIDVDPYASILILICLLVKALLSSTRAAMASPSSMSARTPRTPSRFCASAIFQVDYLSTLTDHYFLPKVNLTSRVPTSQDLDGTSFMGSRLRIEHSRDSRDARDRGRYSPPRGRYG